MYQQFVQPAVQPVVIDVRGVDPEQIIQRGVGVPALAECQFRALRTKSAKAQNARHGGPVDLLAAAPNVLLEETVQTEAPPQRQGQIDLAELAHALDSDPGQIDAGPLGRLRGTAKQIGLRGRSWPPVEQASDLVPPGPLVLIQARQLAQRRDDSLARPSCRADGFHKSPVLVALPVLAPPIPPQEHGDSVGPVARPRNEVASTTCAFGNHTPENMDFSRLDPVNTPDQLALLSNLG